MVIGETMRTSYSQNNTYISCPQHWSWKYQHRLDPLEMGASLYFGSAVDNAVMAMLQGKEEFMEIFRVNWKAQTQWGKTTIIFDNPNVTYGYADFDADLLKEEDLETLRDWGNTKDPVQMYKDIVKKKKNKFKKLNADDKKYFARASWLSLMRKGEILIESFEKQFLPEITEVMATQMSANIKDHNTGDTIGGYIDMVLRIKGYDVPIIFDLKTAARPYTQEQVELTDQLTLYAAMKAAEYNTDLVGYVILVKNIPKNIVAYCKTCGHERRTGQLKTCDNTIKDEKGDTYGRCKGEWNETRELAPQVQVLVEKKTPEQINTLLVDHGNIIHSMKEGIVYKDLSKCNNWYGGQCPYYGACHNNDLKNLKKRS